MSEQLYDLRLCAWCQQACTETGDSPQHDDDDSVMMQCEPTVMMQCEPTAVTAEPNNVILEHPKVCVPRRGSHRRGQTAARPPGSLEHTVTLSIAYHHASSC